MVIMIMFETVQSVTKTCSTYGTIITVYSQKIFLFGRLADDKVHRQIPILLCVCVRCVCLSRPPNLILPNLKKCDRVINGDTRALPGACKKMAKSSTSSSQGSSIVAKLVALGVLSNAP